MTVQFIRRFGLVAALVFLLGGGVWAAPDVPLNSQGNVPGTPFENLQNQIDDLQIQIDNLQSNAGILNTTYLQGFNSTNHADNGVLTNRTLNFNKVDPDSKLRITYSDNLRVTGGIGVAVAWIIKIDGNQVLQTTLREETPGDLMHRQSTVVGYAEGIGTGPHTLTIEVASPAPGFPATSAGDILTGHYSNFLVEVQELP